MPGTLLDLDRPTSWPAALTAYLDQHHDMFRAWEAKTVQASAALFDVAIDGLRDILLAYAIRGWHCTRLTDAEADEVLNDGMRLPNAETLTRRIEALAQANLIEPEIALRLKSKNWADEENRVGMVWFCFFPPRKAEECGIGPFFRHWGGEALYRCHEDDPVIAPILRCIGTPRLIEADVPIASLGRYPDFVIYRRYLVSRGYRSNEPTDFEGYSKHPLPAANVRRVISYPERDFYSLTSCSEWGTYALDRENRNLFRVCAGADS